MYNLLKKGNIVFLDMGCLFVTECLINSALFLENKWGCGYIFSYRDYREKNSVAQNRTGQKLL